MAATLNQPVTILGTPDRNTFVLGGVYEFQYRGERRWGKVEEVKPQSIIMFCELRGAYRQFRYDVINKA
jgi:hypothetical protein